jgi:hypothetical protein
VASAPRSADGLSHGGANGVAGVALEELPVPRVWTPALRDHGRIEFVDRFLFAFAAGEALEE